MQMQIQSSCSCRNVLRHMPTTASLCAYLVCLCILLRNMRRTESMAEETERSAGDGRPPALWEADVEVVMALRTLESVEKDACALSTSLSSLLASLQSALSKSTTSSVQHLQCYNEGAGRMQEAALDAAMKGNKFINSCLRLNEEMKGMANVANQLKVLRQTVDHLDRHVSRFLQ